MHGPKVLPPCRERPSQRTLKRRRTARRGLLRASGSGSGLPPTMRRGCTTWRWRIPPHIYLLNREGQVVRYIYPSLTPEQLAKRLTDLAQDG